MEKSENKTKAVIFETHDRHPKMVFSGDRCLLKFNRQNINLTKTADGASIRLRESDSWICVLEDPELIELARKDKRYGEDSKDGKFWEVGRIPTKSNKSSSVISGAQVSRSGSEGINSGVDLQKAYRYGELKARVIKADGSVSAKASIDEVEEYHKLKKDLGELV